MAWQSRKKPLQSHLYACAEDLCDPFDTPAHAGAGAAEGIEADPPRKPRAHAVRLMDELGEGDDPPQKPIHAKEVFQETPPVGRAPRESQSQRSPRSRRSANSSIPPKDPAEFAATEYTILSIKPVGEGETVAVVLSMPGDTSEASAEAGNPPRKRLQLFLLVEQYADLHPREGSISPDEAEELLTAGRFCAAVKRGMRLLQYGDQSARRLAYKLRAKGIDRADADRAAAYLVEKGYIHEDDTARLRAEESVRKLWGPRRIREDLRAHGFAPDAIAEAMESLDEVDFEENCVELIRKKYRDIPKDRVERRAERRAEQQKMIAALTRMGYDYELIRAAMRRAEHEED